MSQIIILLSFLLVVLLLPLKDLLNVYFLYLSVILLPLRSASLTHKNHQRCKIIIIFMKCVPRTRATINQFEDFVVEYPAHGILSLFFKDAYLSCNLNM